MGNQLSPVKPARLTGGQRRLATRYARWLLLAGFLVISAVGWMRMAVSITDWYWYEFAGVQPSPLYLTLSGALWGLVGLAAFVWIVLRRPGSAWAGMAAALLILLTYWIDRLLISQNATQNTGFAIALSLFWLMYTYLVLLPTPRPAPARAKGD